MLDWEREISKLEGTAAWHWESGNRNRYRLLLRKDETLIAYFASCPLYRESDGRLLQPDWETSGDGFTYRGVNALVETKQSLVKLSNAFGCCQISLPPETTLVPSANGVGIRLAGAISEISLQHDLLGTLRCSTHDLALMQDEYLPFFTVCGLFGEGDSELRPLKIYVTSQSEHGEILRVCCPSARSMVLEANLYAPKMMFDTTVESAHPQENNAFGGIAFLGRTEEWGEQWLYVRFDATQLQDLPGRIVRAQYLIPRLGGIGQSVAAWRSAAPFCSFGSNWENRIACGDLVAQAKGFDKYQSLEVTNEIRTLIQQREPRHAGLIVRSIGAEGSTVLSTADNYVRPQLLRIELHQ